AGAAVYRRRAAARRGVTGAGAPAAPSRAVGAGLSRAAVRQPVRVRGLEGDGWDSPAPAIARPARRDAARCGDVQCLPWPTTAVTAARGVRADHQRLAGTRDGAAVAAPHRTCLKGAPLAHISRGLAQTAARHSKESARDR